MGDIIDDNLFKHECTDGNMPSCISLFITPDATIESVKKLLHGEIGTWANVKCSVKRRKELYNSITAIQQKLKRFKSVPENGLIFYAGKIEDIRICYVLTHIPVKECYYRADVKFHTAESIRIYND